MKKEEQMHFLEWDCFKHEFSVGERVVWSDVVPVYIKEEYGNGPFEIASNKGFYLPIQIKDMGGKLITERDGSDCGFRKDWFVRAKLAVSSGP